LPAAIAFAKDVASVRPLPSVRQLSVAAPADAGAFDKARADLAKTRRNLEAPQPCVDCVQAATKLDLDAGIAYEKDVVAKLVTSDQARALRLAFFGEHAASKIADVPDSTPVRKIEKVAVIGAGTMGGGITMCFLNAGIPVTLLEMKQEAIDR